MNMYKRQVLFSLFVIFSAVGIVKPISETTAGALMVVAGITGTQLGAYVYKKSQFVPNSSSKLRKYYPTIAKVAAGLMAAVVMYKIVEHLLPANQVEEAEELFSSVLETLGLSRENFSREEIMQKLSSDMSLRERRESFPKKFTIREAEYLLKQAIISHSSIAQYLRAYFHKPDLIAAAQTTLEKAIILDGCLEELCPSTKTELIAGISHEWPYRWFRKK